MSRGRWDRNKAARQQRWESDYAELGGGLDQSTAAMRVKPGRMSYCVNWEEVFGSPGYSTIKGYERFDGTTPPSEYTYRAIPFEDGNDDGPTAQPATLTDDGGADAVWLMTHVESGTLAGGDAVGYFVVLEPLTAGEFVASEFVRYLGVACGTATDTSLPADVAFSFHQEALTAARTYGRALITEVPGDGPILGVAVFNGSVYAARCPLAGSGLATIWRTLLPGESTASVPGHVVFGNWLQVQGGFHNTSPFRFKAATFTGDPTSRRLFVVNGRDRLCSIIDEGSTLRADPVFGTEATSNTLVVLGLGAKNFTVNEAARDFVAGQEVTAWEVGNAFAFVAGTVTSYNSGTGALVINATSFGSAGSPNDWEIGLSDFSDKPYLLQPHKNHMFLGYPGGQLQTSDLGDPFTYGASASLFGMGQELTGLSQLKGVSLAVFCEGKIEILTGSSQLDWDSGEYTSKTGAVIDTIQDNDGNPIYLSNRGLTTLAATQNFGNVAASIFSRDVQRVLKAQRGNAIGSRMAMDSNQYRLYFSDASDLRMTLLNGGGDQVLGPRNISPSVSNYDHVPTCFAEGLVDGRERMFFGTEDDGWIMEEDSGTSFDGEAITYLVRLPFNHLKSPSVDKQFHKVEAELTGATAATINYRQIFDYDDGTFDTGSGTVDAPGTGVSGFDLVAFDAAQFDISETNRAEAPLDGQGRNMALLLWLESDFIEPITIQGLMVFFTLLGVRP
jgi:hypothetical protein